MNKEQILEMKKAYENALITKLAETLGLELSQITAEWSLNQTVINITQGDKSVANVYTFTAQDNNLTLTMMGYRTHTLNNKIIAYEVIPMSINVATLNTLYTLIMNVLNSDPLAASTPVEEVNE